MSTDTVPGSGPLHISLLRPSDFPDAEAAEIARLAREYGYPALEAVVNEVRQWVGDPFQILDVANQWGVEAKSALSEAGDRLGTAMDDVAFHWAGDAYEAFKSHGERVADTVREIDPVLTGMAQNLVNVANAVIDTYNGAVDLIIDFGQYAARVIAVAGSIPFGVGIIDGLGVIDAAINDFVDALQDAKNVVIDAVCCDRRCPGTWRCEAGDALLRRRIPRA